MKYTVMLLLGTVVPKYYTVISEQGTDTSEYNTVKSQ